MAVLDTLMQGPPLTIRAERRGAATVVTLDGSCTMEVSEGVGACLTPLLTPESRVLVIDMSKLDFIDSTGLGGIIAAHLRSRHVKGIVRLVSPQPAVREVLQITWLVKLFPIESSVDAALAAG